MNGWSAQGRQKKKQKGTLNLLHSPISVTYCTGSKFIQKCLFPTLTSSSDHHITPHCYLFPALSPLFLVLTQPEGRECVLSIKQTSKLIGPLSGQEVAQKRQRVIGRACAFGAVGTSGSLVSALREDGYNAGEWEPLRSCDPGGDRRYRRTQRSREVGSAVRGVCTRTVSSPSYCHQLYRDWALSAALIAHPPSQGTVPQSHHSWAFSYT